MSDLSNCPRCRLELPVPIPAKCSRCGYPYLRANDRATWRRTWRSNWLHCLYEFASRHLQKMSWIEGPSAKWPDGEVWYSSFSECMCCYFDDLSLRDGLEAVLPDGLISREEVLLAAAFHQMAEAYEGGDDHQVLADEKWHAVVREAARLWNALKRLTRDPEDQAVIASLESRFGQIEEVVPR